MLKTHSFGKIFHGKRAEKDKEEERGGEGGRGRGGEILWNLK